MKNIAIIGGSLSGVSCAYFLDKLSSVSSRKFNIDIIDKNLEFVNEKISRFQYRQEIYDKGWYNCINGEGMLFYLMIELGLHKYLIESSSTKKVMLTDKGIKYLPEKILYGYPVEKKELLLLDLFDFKDKVSIMYNMHKVFKDKNIQTITIEEFFTSVLNEKIYYKIIEPLLTSHYGSEVSKQNLVALMPELAFLTIQNENIEQVIKEMYDKKVNDGIMFGSQYRLKFTLRSFIESLESNFSDRVFVEFNRAIERVEKKGNKYLVYSNGSIYQYDYVIIATNHKTFLPWFKDDKQIVDFFEKIEFVSNIVVTLIYRKEDLYINSEIGEVIFQKENSYITKVEYVSNKWMDIKTNDIQMIRAYVNRKNMVDKLLDKDDEEIKNIIQEEIRNLHRDLEEPTKYYVTKLKDNFRYCCNSYSENINNFTNYIIDNYSNLYFIGNSKKATSFENTIIEAKEIAKKIIENI